MLDDLPDPPPSTDGLPEGPLCARCADEGPLFPPNCAEKPELLLHQPLGMYHCPDCGAMVVAGIEHGWLCGLCLRREHPGFDRPAPGAA